MSACCASIDKAIGAGCSGETRIKAHALALSLSHETHPRFDRPERKAVKARLPCVLRSPSPNYRPPNSRALWTSWPRTVAPGPAVRSSATSGPCNADSQEWNQHSFSSKPA